MKISILLIITAAITIVIQCNTSFSQPDQLEKLKLMIEKYVYAWNSGDFIGLEDIVSENFELRNTVHSEPIRSLDSLKHVITSIRTAYPDFTITVDEAIYTPDAFAGRWTILATNTGQGSHAPTGKAVNVSGISILHVAGGKLTDEWISGNDLMWLMQLGYILTPPPEREK